MITVISDETFSGSPKSSRDRIGRIVALKNFIVYLLYQQTYSLLYNCIFQRNLQVWFRLYYISRNKNKDSFYISTRGTTVIRFIYSLSILLFHIRYLLLYLCTQVNVLCFLLHSRKHSTNMCKLVSLFLRERFLI